MDKYMEIKVKLYKEKYKLLCITFKESNINYAPEVVHQIVKKMREILTKGTDFYMLIDTRGISHIDKKLVAYTLNDIVKGRIKKSCMIIQNSNIKLLSELILKVHKPVIPFKLCDNNQNAISFIVND